MRPLDLREHRVEVAAARTRSRAEQLDVLGKERDHDELAGDIVGARARAIEEVASRPAALAVGRREEHELDASMPLGAIDLHAGAARRRAPADELGVVVRARRISTRREVDRLEQVRLSRAVLADERGNAACERDLERKSSSASSVTRTGAYAVMRVGMMY
jgi:hypothetical protein